MSVKFGKFVGWRELEAGGMSAVFELAAVEEPEGGRSYFGGNLSIDFKPEQRPYSFEELVALKPKCSYVDRMLIEEAIEAVPK